MNWRSSNTVNSILDNFYLSKKFVVGRGWEKLPKIDGDLDLYVNYADWPLFEKELGLIAELYDWDELIVDYSWAKGFDYSLILVFYFRMQDGSECLQVDLFNGYSVLGCGYLNAKDILEEAQSYNGILIPSSRHFKELREFQIFRHLNWFRHSHNHRVIVHLDFFKIDKALNSRLKLRIAFKRIRIVFLTFFSFKKINIFDRLVYYRNVLKRFKSDAIIDGEKNRRVWMYASEQLLRNKYARDCLITEGISLRNIRRALSVIERNGLLIVLSQRDVPEIDSKEAIKALTKLKLNQRCTRC